jgi:hypothetical protein
MEVFGRVLIGRRVTAADVTAGQAEPEVNPAASCIEAVLTTFSGRLDIVNLIQMRASFHLSSLYSSKENFSEWPLVVDNPVDRREARC